ncbi:MAG: SIMPL domain-containing protein [Anaerolineae bacterium]
MDAILAALKGAGVATKDIQTTGFNIWVEQRTGPDGMATDQVIYHVGNSVSVIVRDLDNGGRRVGRGHRGRAPTASTASPSRWTTPTRSWPRRRSLATEDALARAEELAGLHGVALGEVVSISEVINGAAVPMLESVNASMSMGNAAGLDLAWRATDDRPLAGGLRHRRAGGRLSPLTDDTTRSQSTTAQH